MNKFKINFDLLSRGAFFWFSINNSENKAEITEAKQYIADLEKTAAAKTWTTQTSNPIGVRQLQASS